MNKCISCGKYGNFDILCSNCFLKNNPILAGFKDIQINFCVMCNKYQLKNKWVYYKSINTPITQLVKEKLKFNPSFKIINISIKPRLPEFKKGPGLKLEAEVQLIVQATADGFEKPVKEEYTIPILLNFSYCKKCSKSSSQYFEGILQIRNQNKQVTDYIESKLKSKKKRGVFATKIEKIKSGIDFYLTDTKFIRTFAAELQNKFGGELKISAKLHTRDKQTSKEVFRVNALLRLPDYTIGDIVLVDKQPLRIAKMGKKPIAKNLVTKKQTTIDTKIKLIILESHNTFVSKTQPKLEVLDPETYQSVAVENPIDLKPGQKVKVVKANKKLFLV